MKEELFNQHTITMSDVSGGSASQSQYKDHFYFAVNNSFLVATLAGNTNIDRLQTYINWLLEGVRGDRLFQFAELAKLPDGVPLSDIKAIQLVGGATESGQDAIATKLGAAANAVLDRLLGNDTDSLEKLRSSQLVEAKLELKIRSKNRELAAEEYKRVMSAVITNVTRDSGIVVCTKSGNRLTGEAVRVKKTVSVQCIGPNRIVEEQLKQQMEQFLGELREKEDE